MGVVVRLVGVGRRLGGAVGWLLGATGHGVPGHSPAADVELGGRVRRRPRRVVLDREPTRTLQSSFDPEGIAMIREPRLTLIVDSGRMPLCMEKDISRSQGVQRYIKS